MNFMHMPSRSDRRHLLADAPIIGPVLSVAFLAVVAKASLLTGAIYVLFPEAAALGYDVFKRPEGTWARAPAMLAVTPAITAALGTAFTQALPYGLWSVSLTIAGAILIVRWMRSPIVPAISAAFLPLVFGITSWWYPMSIGAVMSCLALSSVIYGKWLGIAQARQPGAAAAAHVAPALTWSSLTIFSVFLLLVYGLSTFSGLRLMLFPPLVVIAFEIFVLANIHAPARRYLALPLVCTIAAGAGLAALLAFGAGTMSVVVSLLAGIVLLRVLRLHFPPALTIGLLPQIMPRPDWNFVLAIGLGTAMLTAVVLLVRPWMVNRRAALIAG